MNINKKKLKKIVGASNIDVVMKALRGELVDKVTPKQYDTKTKYGMLYVDYNNKKKQLGLPDYSGRDKFIKKMMKNQILDDMFYLYERDGFKLYEKPVLRLKDTEKGLVAKNIECVLRHSLANGNSAKRVTKVNVVNDEVVKIYPSIKACISDADFRSAYAIRKSLNTDGGEFRYFEEGDEEKYVKHREGYLKLKKELDASLNIKEK